MRADFQQPSLLSDVQRSERPWKIARQVSRAAFLEAEARGQITNRREIVGRTLRYHWNRKQQACSSRTLAKWIQLAGKDWKGREWSWILLETRRALCDLRKLGLTDTKPNKCGREFLWRWREAGTGERPIDSRRTA